jgi:hypothetical protein
LENISKMISDASSVIAKYLNIWLCQATSNRMIDRPCNFVYHELHFPFFVSPCLQFWTIHSATLVNSTRPEQQSDRNSTEPVNWIWLSLNSKRPDGD